MLFSTMALVRPVATQPGKSGIQALYPVPVFSKRIRYFTMISTPVLTVPVLKYYLFMKNRLTKIIKDYHFLMINY